MTSHRTLSQPRRILNAALSRLSPRPRWRVVRQTSHHPDSIVCRHWSGTVAELYAHWLLNREQTVGVFYTAYPIKETR